MSYNISVFRSEVKDRFETAEELKQAIETSPGSFEDFSEEEYMRLKSFLKARDYEIEEDNFEEIFYAHKFQTGVKAILRKNALHFSCGDEGMHKYEILDASGEATLESDNLERFDFQDNEWFV